MEIKQRDIVLPSIFALVIIIGMQIGINYSESNIGKYAISQKDKVSKLDEVLNKVYARYVDNVDLDQLSSAAIQGIFSELDPHSHYISKKELQAYSETLAGRFEGIGIEFSLVNDTIMVVNTIKGGPSEKLGLQSGDMIVTIDGKGVAGVNIGNNDVMKLLKGPNGTKVTVEIFRKGNDQYLEFTITRGRVPIYSVDGSFMVDEQIGYIRINKFGESTHFEFVQAVNDLVGRNMKKLILDLRNNPGGYLLAAIKVVDELLDDQKLLVYTKGRSYPKKEYRATNKGVFKEGAIVVLMDEYSASASEILAGAVQDWSRGVIIGRRSFGKGLVQEQFMLPDSSAIRLTISKYFTPSGRCIQKPYDDGLAKYSHDLYERYQRGEFETPDSIKFADSLRFITPTGKVVYGGGGIMPDIFVPIDTSYYTNYLRNIRAKGLIVQYAYSYYARNSKFFSSFTNENQFNNDFIISDNMMEKFFQYAQINGVERDEKEIAISKNEIAIRLKAYIARTMLKSNGYFSVLKNTDNTFQMAYKTLKSR